MIDDLMKTDGKKPRSKLNQMLRRLFRWLLTLRGSPESIGMGVAIGFFVACCPLLGIHLLLAIVLSTVLGANRPAALTLIWLNNPATFVPLFAFEYWVGSFFWPGPPMARFRQVLGETIERFTSAGFFSFHEHVAAVLEVGRDIFIPLLIGGTLLGILVGTASYFPTVALVRKLRAKRQKRRKARDEAGRTALVE